MSRALSASKKSGHQSHPAGPAPSTTPNAAGMDASRRKPTTLSKSHGKGLLHRKSTKRAESSGTHAEKGSSPGDPQDAGTKSKQKGTDGQPQQQSSPSPQQQQMNPPVRTINIIPDPLSELPAWYSSDADWAVTSAAQFRAKYPIHNCHFGPRYYRNHHLLPPRDARPPSVFSPVFPPMAPDAPDSPKVAGPSRTPSGSPLPTPNSSQIRLHDGKGRPRKLSQGAQDSASVLDGMDPWGSNWHDKSPYDLGSHDRSSPDLSEHVSPIAPPPVHGRPRRASLTPPQRHKTTVPSPLSQSTSAVHLASEPLSTHLPRRLSKSRKPFRGLFNTGSDTTRLGSHSAPATPGDYSTNSLGRKVSRTGSLIPPSIASSSASLAPTEKRKRGSILGRLARRFSVMRKSNTSPSLHDSVRSARQSLSADVHAEGYQPPSQPPHEEKPLETAKRVPPPSAESESVRARHDAPRQEASNAQPVVPLEPSFSPGKLHIANPDEPTHSSIQAGPSSPKSPNNEANTNSSESMQRVASEHSQTSPSMESVEYNHIPHTALSVISEGETYNSTPRSRPLEAIDGSPVSLPTIPSILSQPPQTAQAVSQPPEIFIQPSSPSLPSLPPPTPISKGDYSLPPTPTATATSVPPTPTPIAKDVPLPSVTPTLQYTPRPRSTEKVDRLSSYAEEERDVLPPDMYSPITRRVYEANDPLSRASMIVNPPTPFTPSIVIPPSTASSVPPMSPRTETTDNTSPKKDGSQRTSRRTETFKLVRSNSGDVPTTAQGFIVAGEHWEVVESPVDRSPSKKSKKADRTEGKKRESSPDDGDAQRKRSVHRKSATVNDRRTEEQDAFQRVARARSTDAPRHSESVERRGSTKNRHSIEGTRATQTPIYYGSRPVAIHPATAHTAQPSAGVERRTSTPASTRPTSEFQSTADLNTLRAKEAWDMERLWKGRSAVYESEGAPTPRPHISSDSRPTTIMSADLHRASTIPSVGDSTSALSQIHGSGHTYFVVQTPRQGVPHTYSHPPIYAPAPAQDQNSTSPGHSPHSVHNRSFSDNVPYGGITKLPELPPPRSNPLPELPRMSTYKPPPLPASLANLGSGTPA